MTRPGDAAAAADYDRLAAAYRAAVKNDVGRFDGMLAAKCRRKERCGVTKTLRLCAERLIGALESPYLSRGSDRDVKTVRDLVRRVECLEAEVERLGGDPKRLKTKAAAPP